jgi:hypothetical protein
MNLTAEQPMVARFSLATAEPIWASAGPLARWLPWRSSGMAWSELLSTGVQLLLEDQIVAS